MRIVEEFTDGKNIIYEGSLREWPMMREITPTANNGIKLRIRREDEFGHDTFVEIIFEAEDLQEIKKKQLFNDPLI